MSEDDLVQATSSDDLSPNGQLTAVQIEELIEMHEQCAADALQIFASSGEESVKYFGERSAKTASALRFLLQEREECGEALGRITVISSRALDAGNHMQGLVWIKKVCFDAGFNLVPAPPQRQGDRPVPPHGERQREPK